MNCKYYSEFVETVKCDIDELYDISCVGGCLHIVVDDDNIENDHIQWCIENANPDDDDFTISVKIAHNMLTMSMKEKLLLVVRDSNNWPNCEGIVISNKPYDCQNCCVERECFDSYMDDSGIIHWDNEFE